LRIGRVRGNRPEQRGEDENQGSGRISHDQSLPPRRAAANANDTKRPVALRAGLRPGTGGAEGSGLIIDQLMKTRGLWLVLALVVCLPATAAAQAFYQLYEQGLDLYKAGKYAEAKAKFQAAKAKSSKQGPKILFYGLRYDEYVPDYYLGLIAKTEGDNAEALRLLENVENAKLLANNDRVKRLQLQSALGDLRQVAVRTDEGPKRAPEPPPPPPPPAYLADFQRALQTADQALTAKRWADAHTGANTARGYARDAATQQQLAAFERRLRAGEGADLATQARAALTRENDAEADQLITRLAAADPSSADLATLRKGLTDLRTRKESDRAAAQRAAQAAQLATQSSQYATSIRGALERRDAAAASQGLEDLAALNPSYPAIAELTTRLRTLEIELKASLDNEDLKRRRGVLEREAMTLFYKGDYANARTRIQSFRDGPSDRMRLYLACSQAALALVQKDASLAAEAGRTYSVVKPALGQFTSDMRYISPAIQKVLASGTL
jgi:TolA-binding protein